MEQRSQVERTYNSSSKESENDLLMCSHYHINNKLSQKGCEREKRIRGWNHYEKDGLLKFTFLARSVRSLSLRVGGEKTDFLIPICNSAVFVSTLLKRQWGAAMGGGR